MSLTPIFIVSTGRAGSQMLAHVLRKHPAILALHEPLPVLHTEAYAQWKNTAPFESILKRVQIARTTTVDQIAQNGLTYVESSHFCSHLIPQLEALFKPKFIHLARECSAFVRSGMSRGWYEEEYPLIEKVKNSLRHRFMLPVGNPGADHRLSPPEEMVSRVQKHAWLWSEINSIIVRDLKKVPDERHLYLKLENMGADAIKSVIEYIGVDADDKLLKAMIDVSEHRPNKSRKKLEWQPTAQEAVDISNVAQPMLKELGYA